MSTVAFVGLGDMGSRMVPHLLRANHKVVVFDVLRDRLDAISAIGTVTAENPAAAARERMS
ncbi:MAG TPA: NAD(P)-binding domain-containing protein [Terriglobales bacterium]|nr:NAD(P)-binding domain-containing protein [Terriglobales bacterium]